ncbi:Cytochrome P450 9e2 [Cryptotermes secundus]|uniref:Cytochrome P450 9e2 n=1 Tax=Cryptotermes secundus TaxID=105785 RepID=A0A2J7Q488_9NEOP|nr:Cytochrome P450 9e2 [Cryptotermes secundus]
MLESLWVWTLATGLISIIGYLLGTWTHDHFSKKNVPHLKPVPFFGNMGSVAFRIVSLPESLVDWYNRLKGHKYGGVYEFLNPIILLRDPELIKMVTVKDFEHFVDRGVRISEEVEPLFGKGLFSLKGQRWKDMRSTLSPAFTSSKMKNMFVLITECGKQLTDFLEKCINDKNMTIEGCKIEREGNILAVEMKDLFTRYTNDVIATSAFGIKWEDDDITAQVALFFLAGFDTASSLLSFASQLLAMHPDIQSRLQDEIDQTLKVDGGNLTYEAVHGMKYLDMVVSAPHINILFTIYLLINNFLDYVIFPFHKSPLVSLYNLLKAIFVLSLVIYVTETLRIYPPIGILERRCVQTYTLPAEPHYTLNPGDFVYIPVYALHHDPDYFPDPEKFDPERFSDENKGSIKACTYLPFGSGPRNCIGKKYLLSV